MTAPLCFVDTETLSLAPDRAAWEIAIIRREPTGSEADIVVQVLDLDLSVADPFALTVGGFYERHCDYAGAAGADYLSAREDEAASIVEEWTRGAHLVGVNPAFDAGTLDPMLRRHGLLPGWHYHLLDMSAMALGYLNGRTVQYDVDHPGAPTEDWQRDRLQPPWRSEALSRACDVEPPGEDDRHTALGDARWAMRWYDAITGGA